MGSIGPAVFVQSINRLDLDVLNIFLRTLGSTCLKHFFTLYIFLLFVSMHIFVELIRLRKNFILSKSWRKVRHAVENGLDV